MTEQRDHLTLRMLLGAELTEAEWDYAWHNETEEVSGDIHEIAGIAAEHGARVYVALYDDDGELTDKVLIEEGQDPAFTANRAGYIKGVKVYFQKKNQEVESVPWVFIEFPYPEPIDESDTVTILEDEEENDNARY